MNESSPNHSSEKSAEGKTEHYPWMKKFQPDKNCLFVGGKIDNEQGADGRTSCDIYDVKCIYATIGHFCNARCPIRKAESLYRGLSDE